MRAVNLFFHPHWAALGLTSGEPAFPLLAPLRGWLPGAWDGREMIWPGLRCWRRIPWLSRIRHLPAGDFVLLEQNVIGSRMPQNNHKIFAFNSHSLPETSVQSGYA